jgi:hypothetical protein
MEILNIGVVESPYYLVPFQRSYIKDKEVNAPCVIINFTGTNHGTDTIRTRIVWITNYQICY